MTREEIIRNYVMGKSVFLYDEVKEYNPKPRLKYYHITELVSLGVIPALPKREKTFREEDLPDFMK